MRTSELQGALLDYWVAEAQGLDVTWRFGRGVQWRRTTCGKPGCAVIHKQGASVPAYSADWTHGGALIDHRVTDIMGGGEQWAALVRRPDRSTAVGTGRTLLVAVCRAVVAAAFGDEVEDLPE